MRHKKANAPPEARKSRPVVGTGRLLGTLSLTCGKDFNITGNSVTQRRIIIRPEAWGALIDVVIEPPLIGEDFDRDFATVSEARSYAAGLSERSGMPVLDESADAIGGDA